MARDSHTRNGKPSADGFDLVVDNRKARHDFFIEETLEAGLALTGTEVKSLRAHRANLRDSYARIKNGEAFLESSEAAIGDLVVVAEFRDPIYPGLVSTGKVQRGGDKPFHAVINSENYHALETLLFTNRGKVDARLPFRL